MPDGAGVALAPLTVEQRLRVRIAELEERVTELEVERDNYEKYWRASIDRAEAYATQVGELTAALARVGLRLP